MKQLINNIRECRICEENLPLGPRPVVNVNSNSKILIVGQAPGLKVHQSGIPWDDQSGIQLRQWLDVSDSEFYDQSKFGLVPMGFCYPGKGNSGDLPPRPECAPTWHQLIFEKLTNLKMIILIGAYSQNYYLKDKKGSLTENVRAFKEFLPRFFPLPHPSPRNRYWLVKNPWFNDEVLFVLRNQVTNILNLKK